MTQRPGGLRCALMRGGTSKGAVLLATDLPADEGERDELLLRLMGSPDPRQVDGLGGAHPLTSKVAVVSRSADDAADVDYLFLQVQVDRAVVSSSQTCGNMLAAVAPFAVERGLVRARDDRTSVRIRLVNTGALAELVVRTPDGTVTYEGDAAVAGVPGSASPVEILLDPPSGPLLSTGNVQEVLDGLEVTCIDAGMPTVVVRAADLGVTGTETPAVLEADDQVTDRVRRLRLAAFDAMRLPGDPAVATTPKVVLVGPPAHGGDITTRSFIPERVHEAIGVLGAASVAAALRSAGTIAYDCGAVTSEPERVRVEHPTGHLDLIVQQDDNGLGRISVVRTARLIFDGTAYPVPHHPAPSDTAHHDEGDLP